MTLTEVVIAILIAVGIAGIVVPVLPGPDQDRPQDEDRPGSTGTTMPAMPTAIRIVITTSVRVTRGACHNRCTLPPGDGGALALRWP